MARALTILKISFFSNLKRWGSISTLFLGQRAEHGDRGIDVRDSPRNEEFHQKMVSFRVIEALRYLVDLVSTLSRRRAVVSREVILR
jgi:hypothetical protein